jgi:hypothetical protein
MIPRSCLWGAEYVLLIDADESVTIELSIQIPPPALVDKAVGLIKAIREGNIEEWAAGPAPKQVVVPARQEQHTNSYVLVTLWAY